MIKGKNIQSVQRAIDIINCFDENNVELSLHEISERLALNKSTVHGIISTLFNNRFLQQNSNGHYMLGPALMNMTAYANNASKTRLRNVSKGYIARISNKYQCTCHVFTLEGSRLKFLDMTTPVNSYYVISTVLNDLMHLYCTASGKLLLSWLSPREREEFFLSTELKAYTSRTLTTREAILENLETILQKGYSLENEEIEEGCISIAVPVFTDQSQLFATISITGSKVKIAGKIEAIASDLKEVSEKITRDLF
jgi:DNA-binding IclR family transcriptional regulator